MLIPRPTLISIVEEALLLIPCKDRNCCKSFGAKEKNGKKLCSIKKRKGEKGKKAYYLQIGPIAKRIRMTPLMDHSVIPKKEKS